MIRGLLFWTYRIARLLTSATGRSVAWTRLRHRGALHQTATTTAPDRYPVLFTTLAERLPSEARILSFGCSTGEELVSLRQLMPGARLSGVEINPRARRLARRRMASDPLSEVVATLPDQRFDAVLALAVLQREPHRVADDGIVDLGRIYPFERFDECLDALVACLGPGGLLAIYHAHYRVEDSRAAAELSPLAGTPLLTGPLFDRKSRRYVVTPPAASLWVKGDARCAAIAVASPNS